jgi:predicted RNA-binding protein with PUA-like domain
MSYWLLKTEPDCYSWADLARDQKTVWDGVSNALALKHIRTMAKGDLALIYHTGDERAAVGVAEVVSGPHPDPNADDERAAVVDVKPRQKLERPVTLSDIKADPAFAGWDLLHISRLSVVPVPEKMWERVLELAASAAAGGAIGNTKENAKGRRVNRK